MPLDLPLPVETVRARRALGGLGVSANRALLFDRYYAS